MKTFYEYKSVLAGIGYTLLITSLAGCDWSTDPNMNADNAGAGPGYNAGYDFGIKLALLRQQQPDIKLDDALNGLRDALLDTNQLVSRTELCARLQPVELEPAEVEFQPAESFEPPLAETQLHNIIDFTNEDYVAPRSSREGVVTLPSGVQYEVLKAGSGEPPRTGDTVVISYQASLDNGTVIDASDIEAPLHISLDDIVAPGLKETLLLMNAGATWQVVLPPTTGYSNPGSRMFRGRENRMIRRRDLIYDIELVSIDRAQPAKAGN